MFCIRINKVAKLENLAIQDGGRQPYWNLVQLIGCYLSKTRQSVGNVEYMSGRIFPDRYYNIDLMLWKQRPYDNDLEEHMDSQSVSILISITLFF